MDALAIECNNCKIVHLHIVHIAENIHDGQTIAAFASTPDTMSSMHCIDNANGVCIELNWWWGVNCLLKWFARNWLENVIHTAQRILRIENGNYSFENILRLHSSLTASGWDVAITKFGGTSIRELQYLIQCWQSENTLSSCICCHLQRHYHRCSTRS